MSIQTQTDVAELQRIIVTILERLERLEAAMRQSQSTTLHLPNKGSDAKTHAR
jgi:hypothetical protein